jgi:hypothetical protein
MSPDAITRLAIATLLTTTIARGDLVELGDDDRIAGEVTTIGEDGRVTLKSELSDQPLLVRPEKITRVVFESEAEPPAGSPDQQVELDNGDRVPCQILSMDDEAVRIKTWFAGELRVPRAHVAALHFGVTEPALLFGGEQRRKGWTKSEAWSITEDGMFVSGGVGRTAHMMPDGLPARFIVRFRYEWKGNPNLRFYFANDLPDQGVADRYMLSINSAGMELKRQSTSGRTNHSLAQDHRRPKEISPEGMDIEIRVDREQRELRMLINGDLVDRFIDPVDRVPSGNGLMLESAASGSSANFVRGLEVLEWTEDPQNRRTKNAGDPDKDTVLDRQGEHFSGVAESITGPAAKPEIVFRHPHAAEPLKVPLDRAAALFFRKNEGAAPANPSKFVLKLADNGALSLDSCQVDASRATCKHPHLGELKIDRRAIRGLLRNPPPPPES